jgi:uncharacterized ParB-like nuclease family protein
MKKLNLLAIRIDGGTQARLAINEAVVGEYAARMDDGEDFPPVTVFFDQTDYWLADGFHRYHAIQKNGKASINADVREGSLEDAILYSYGANSRRGLSMTPEDNLHIIKSMFCHPKWRLWSNNEIARQIGMSGAYIGRIKRDLERDERIPVLDGDKTYKRQGVELQMNTEKLGKKEGDKEKPKEQESSEDGNDDKIQELAETISDISEENQKLKDAIAVGQWDASDIEKIDIQEVLETLREENRILNIDNKALRDSRDMYQSRNAELMGTVKSLQSKIKSLEKK